ncbi:MAG: tyrosine-type recombinase/integrase, partial [Bacteroidia bacterium]
MLKPSLLARKTKKGYSLFIRYYDDEQQKPVGSETLNLIVSKNFPCIVVQRMNRVDKETMEIAELILLKRKAEILEGRFQMSLLPSEKKEIDIMKYVKEVVAQKKHSTYDTMLFHLTAFLDKNRICITDSKGVEAFQTYLKSLNLSDTSVSVYMSRLKIVFLVLIERKIFKENPFDKVEIQKENKKPITYYTLEEVNQIAEAEVDAKYLNLKYAYLFACCTGLRRSDIVRLTWNQVKGG